MNQDFMAGMALGLRERAELHAGFSNIAQPTYEFDAFGDRGHGKDVYVCTEHGVSRRVNIESELSFAAGYVAGWREYVGVNRT